jgi:divalent metal cation (Fe/Co/Zn/Cd) transporter
VWGRKRQAFVLTSVRRGERAADPRHPFGYGQERYFWSLLIHAVIAASRS